MTEIRLSARICSYQQFCQARRDNHGESDSQARPTYCELVAELKNVAVGVSQSDGHPAVLQGYLDVVADIDDSRLDGCVQPIEVHQRAYQVEALIVKAQR